MRALGWVVIIGGLLLVAGVVGSSQTRSTSSTTSSSSATPSSNEIVLTAEMKRGMGALIRSRGYNCPEPKLSFGQGQDAYGTVVQLYCGPIGQDGVYEKAVFRVTIRPDKSILVAPWN